MRDIVLLHGGAQGGWVWDETVSALESQRGPARGRVLRLDVPGCGVKRGRDTSGMGVAEVVDELADDLDRHDVRDALLVGHSQAGTILPALAAARSARIAGLVYVACCAPAQGQTVTTMMGTAARGACAADEVGWPLDPASHTPEDLFAAMFCNDMDEGGGRVFLEKLGQDAWPVDSGAVSSSWSYAAAAGIPATYVIALQDNVLPPDWQERFAERLGVRRIVRIDAGHQAMTTRPHGLAEILLCEAAAIPQTTRGA